MRAIWILCLCALASVGQAQTSAPPASAPAAEYLRHFSKDYRTLLVIPDPLPNLQRVLTNPRLQQLWRDGRLTKFIRTSEPKTVLPPLDAVWMIVLQNHRWVPSEIVIGVPEQAWTDYDHLFRTIAYATFFQAANLADGGEKVLPKLQDSLLAELKGLRIPPTRIWVKFRAEDDATQLFEAACAIVDGSKADLEIPYDVKIDDNTLNVAIALAKVMPTKEERIGMLHDFELISGDDDPKAEALADAMVKVKLEASLGRHGDGLLLTLGRTPAGQPMTAGDLGTAYVNDDRTIFFASWDIRSLVKSVKGLNELWQQWSGSEIGAELVAFDEEDFGGDLRALARQLDTFPPTGSSRLWADANALRFRMLQDQAPQVPALKESPISALIPADIEGMEADTVSTLAERVAGTLGQFEVKLAQQEVRQASRGQTAAEEISEAYYESFDPLRQFVNHESQMMFKPGFAMLYGGENVIRKLEVASSKKASDRFTISNVPVVEVAFLAAPAGDEKGTQYIEKLYTEFAKGLTDATKEFRKSKDPPLTKLTKQEDLDLGVPTWTFDLAWAKALASDYSLAIDGDARPHYFVHNGALVISTSPKLSQRMLAAAKNGTSLKPSSDQPGTLVAYGHIPGKVITRLVDDLGVWVAELTKNSPRPKAKQKAIISEKEARAVIGGIGEYFGLVEKVEWRTLQEQSHRTTDGGVTFVP